MLVSFGTIMKNLKITTIFLSMLLISGSSAYAEVRNYRFSRSVQKRDQELLIQKRLHIERTQNSEIIRSKSMLSDMSRRLIGKVKRLQQNEKFRARDLRATQQKASAIAREAKERSKRLAQLQKDRLLQQKMRLENLRNQQRKK